MILQFDSIRKRLHRELRDRLERDVLNIDEDCGLLYGFLNPSSPEKLTNSTILGGTTIPMIMLIGNESGRIYPFALRALIKNLEEYADKPNKCSECKRIICSRCEKG